MYIYSGILLNHKKEQNWGICHDVYLGIILEKHAQDLYPENYKMLMKKSKKD